MGSQRDNPADARMAADPTRFDAELLASAAAMTPQEKLLAGPDLFAEAIEMMAAALRAEDSTRSDDRIESLIRDRLALARRLDPSD